MDEVLPKTAPDSPQGVLGHIRFRRRAHLQELKIRQCARLAFGGKRGEMHSQKLRADKHMRYLRMSANECLSQPIRFS